MTTESDLEVRVALLERQMEEVLARLGLNAQPSTGPAPGVSTLVQDLAARGRKIEAIKVLREQTGMSLAEAKRTVESLPRP